MVIVELKRNSSERSKVLIKMLIDNSDDVLITLFDKNNAKIVFNSDDIILIKNDFKAKNVLVKLLNYSVAEYIYNKMYYAFENEFSIIGLSGNIANEQLKPTELINGMIINTKPLHNIDYKDIVNFDNSSHILADNNINSSIIYIIKNLKSRDSFKYEVDIVHNNSKIYKFNNSELYSDIDLSLFKESLLNNLDKYDDDDVKFIVTDVLSSDKSHSHYLLLNNGTLNNKNLLEYYLFKNYNKDVSINGLFFKTKENKKNINVLDNIYLEYNLSNKVLSNKVIKKNKTIITLIDEAIKLFEFNKFNNTKLIIGLSITADSNYTAEYISAVSRMYQNMNFDFDIVIEAPFINMTNYDIYKYFKYHNIRTHYDYCKDNLDGENECNCQQCINTRFLLELIQTYNIDI